MNHLESVCPTGFLAVEHALTMRPGQRHRPTWMREDVARQEIAECEGRARQGDPSAARRLAELFELLLDDEQASSWWLCAAALGDPDAVDIVNYGLLPVHRTRVDWE